METKKATAIFLSVIGIVTPVLFGNALPIVAGQPAVKGALVTSLFSPSNDSSFIGLNGQKLQPPQHPDIPTYDHVRQTLESMGTRVQFPPKPLFSFPPPLQSSRDRDGPSPKDRAKGKGTGGRGGGGGGGGVKQRPPIVRQKIPDDETLAPYHVLFGRRLEDGLKKKGRKQQVLTESRFSLNLPPLAMAEYLLLTGDFTSFDEAMADIVAIGMMSPWEAEIYRQEVGIEYQSLVTQETEAELANLYGEYKEISPSLVGDMFRSPVFSPFVSPPFAPAVQYPDSGNYGNQNADVIFDREPPSVVAAMNDETSDLPSSEYIGELLKQMADKDENDGPMDRDEMIDTQTTSSTVSPEEHTIRQGGGEGGVQGGGGVGGGERVGKTGKAGGKNGSGKGGKKKTKSKGKGRKGGGAGEKGKPSSSSTSSSVSKDADPEVVTLTQNKTKEANGTKTRRPLSKQSVISSVEH